MTDNDSHAYPANWLPPSERPDPVVDEEAERIQRSVDASFRVMQANAEPADPNATQYPTSWGPLQKDRI